MRIEEAFARVVGRPASEAERERLYRLRDALEVRDNDAFWYIVMTLEQYDSVYREYPKQIAAEATKAIEGTRQAFAEAAALESAKAQQVLAKQVAQTSLEIAHKLADRDKGLGPSQVAWLVAGLVVFGALCMNVGYALATSDKPPWGTHGGMSPGRLKILSAVLGAPAGWMAFALALPMAATGGRWAWTLAADPMAARIDKAIGWALVGLCVASAVASAVVLAEVM